MDEQETPRRSARRSRVTSAVVASALLVGGGAGAVALTSPTATAVSGAQAAHVPAHTRHISAADAATVRRLADIEEIHQLKARYFRSIDTKQWSKLAGLFTAHPTIDVGKKYSSGKEMARTTAALLGDAPTAHQGFLPEIEVHGDTATGTWAMEDYVSFPPGSAYNTGFHGYGQYHETYKRVKGHWYIDSTLLTRFRRGAQPAGRLHPGDLGSVSKVPPVPRRPARHLAALSNRPSSPLRGQLSALRCPAPDAAGPALRAAGATFETP